MISSTCPYCGVGCGITATDGVITGDATHPANAGKLCVKGATLAQTLDDSRRLLTPFMHGQPTSWDNALDHAAAGFKAAIAQHGPDSVAFYGSGQFLTEDYYVANKLMKGFIGSANMDTNSRLCMASTVSGHRRAFGEDVVPGAYADIEEADLLIFVGANAAWCHPVLFERAQATRAARGTKIVVIDPRRTASAALADLHLPIAPDADILLFSRLLTEIAARGALNESYIARHTNGFHAALAASGTGDTGIPEADLETFFDWFCRTEKTVTFFSQGVNQSTSGSDKVNAIINVHLATGRIGRPGMGPFSLTGQPNAMGGREVGGLANQLAAHLMLDSAPDRAVVAEFWGVKQTAAKPGLKAVDMFDAVLAGKIKAIFIAATNPAESLPRATRIRAALEACPLVVVADCWPTETTRLADIILPAAGWSEKDGTVTNSERCISRQRAFRPAPGEAKPDWWMFTELARRMGFAHAFPYQTQADIFREHAALSGFRNPGTRKFNISHLAAISDAEYDALTPFQWGGPRLFGDGAFATPDQKARFIAVQPPATAKRDASYPFTLNTGRLRDQWHTMTRTGFVPTLMAGDAEAHVSLSPADAAAQNITDGTLVRLTTRHGSLVLPARLSPGQRASELFAAMHWTEAHSPAGTINRLTGPARDPHSGQPASKHERAALTPLPTLWHGVLVTNLEPAMDGQFHAARVPLEDGLHRVSLAGWKPLAAGEKRGDWAAKLCGATQTAERVEFTDPARSTYRLGIFNGNQCDAALFIAPDKSRLPDAAALAEMIKSARLENRTILLRGTLAAAPPRAKILCVCHNVTAPVIQAAIRAGAKNLKAIGAACKAGTNCGSCKGELAELINQNHMEMAL
jgi:assimilatory nitrate reductase catalytic subunit